MVSIEQIKILEEIWYRTPMRQSLYVSKGVNRNPQPIELYSRFYEDTVEYSGEPQFCDVCSEKMPLTCILDSRDLGYEGYTKEFTLSIYACRKLSCRLPLYQKMRQCWNYWTTAFGISIPQERARLSAWIKPIFNIPSHSFQETNRSYTGWLGDDLVYPIDSTRYSEEWTKDDFLLLQHFKDAWLKLGDVELRCQAIELMGSRFPDYYTAKFGGHPHWRGAHCTVFCDCSFLIKPFFTFSHEITPLFCPSETNFYLFVSVISQQHMVSTCTLKETLA